jgi:hypothetical protein
MPQFQSLPSIRACLPLAAILTMGAAPRQADQLVVTLRPDMADGAVAGVAVAMGLPAPADGTPCWQRRWSIPVRRAWRTGSAAWP